LFEPDLVTTFTTEPELRPVFGAVGVGEDLELLDRVGRRAEDEARVECVVVGGAVEQEVVRLVALSVDVEAAGDVAETAGGGVAILTSKTRGRSDHAGNQGAELGEVAAVQGKVDHFLLIDDDAQGGVAGFDEGSFPHDLDGLALTTHLHGDVHERRLGDAHLHAAARESGEARKGSPHVVGAGLHELNRVEAVRTCGRGPHAIGAGVGGFDGDAGKHRAGFVLGGAGDGTGGLGVGQAGGKPQSATEGEGEPRSERKLTHVEGLLFWNVSIRPTCFVEMSNRSPVLLSNEDPQRTISIPKLSGLPIRALWRGS
jgi:hypothetical protein